MSLSGGLTAGLVAGLTSRAMGGVSSGWNPSRLTGLRTTILAAEARAADDLWQNTAKTDPAVSDTDPVRVSVCPYTAEEFTASSDAGRPLLWDESGGKWSLEFDAVDDSFDGTSHAMSGAWTLGLNLYGTSLANRAIYGNPIGSCVVGTSGDRLLVRSDAGRTWLSPTGVAPDGADLVVTVSRDGSGTVVVAVNGAAISPFSNSLTASETFSFRGVGYNMGSGTIGARLRGLLLSEGVGFTPQLTGYLNTL